LAIGVGALWSLVLPINKSLWTPSYVIFTSGFACLLLAAFICLIDIFKQDKLAQPLLVYGTNPLFVYVLSFLIVTLYLNITIDQTTMYHWLYMQINMLFEPKLASFIFACLHVVLFWYVSLKLYQRKIFIKI
jgi:predicted acyltransferase